VLLNGRDHEARDSRCYGTVVPLVFREFHGLKVAFRAGRHQEQ